MALLLPDPCDAHCPEAFKKEARAALLAMDGRPQGWTQQIESDEGLRQVLLRFIADFANWDNAAAARYLDTGRALVHAATRRSHRSWWIRSPVEVRSRSRP